MSRQGDVRLFILLLILGVQAVGLPLVAGSYDTDFYFHNSEELSFTIPQFQFGGFQIPSINSGPGSVDARTFGYATSNQPSSTGTTVLLSSQIYVAGPESGYAAVVVWLANPFPANVTLDGDVIMHVWMSSSDLLAIYQASLYFMGIAVYTPATSNTTALSVYSSSLTFGNALSSSPQDYVGQLHITEHQFRTGDELIFIAGAASNKQGWQFSIYFDGPSWQSRATIPADPSLTVSEFDDTSSLLSIVILLTSCVLSVRSRLQLGTNYAKCERGEDKS